jgi:hypothetical protein
MAERNNHRNAAANADTARKPMDPFLQRRLYDAVRPKLTRSDLPANLSSALLSSVHTAVSLGATYAEVAQYTRIALTNITNSSEWCVLVAGSVYLRCKKLPRSAATLSCPLLSFQLLSSPLLTPLIRGDESADEATTTGRIAKALEANKNGFSVIIWQPGAHEKEDEERPDAAATTALPIQSSPLFVPASKPSDSTDKSMPVGYTVQRIVRSPLWIVDKTDKKGKATTLRSPLEDAALMPAVLKTIGSIQRRVGLHRAVEGDFCRYVEEGMSSVWGATWHVVLVTLPPMEKSTPVSSSSIENKDRNNTAMYPGQELAFDTQPLVITPAKEVLTNFIESEQQSCTRLDGKGDLRMLEMVLEAHFLSKEEKAADNGRSPTRYVLTLFRTNLAHSQAAEAAEIAKLPVMTRLSRSCSSPSFTAIARYVLYLIAGMAFVAYMSMSGASMLTRVFSGSSHDISMCVREGKAIPFGPATLVFLAYMLPGPLPQLTGVASLLPRETVSILPRLGGTGLDPSLTSTGHGADMSEFASTDPSTPAAIALASLHDGCSMQDTLLAELQSGESAGLLYIAATALALLSVLRMASTSMERGRVRGAINNLKYMRKPTAQDTPTSAAKGSALRHRK